MKKKLQMQSNLIRFIQEFDETRDKYTIKRKNHQKKVESKFFYVFFMC